MMYYTCNEEECKMIAIIVIIGIAALMGGFFTEWSRQKRMTPEQQRLRQRQHAETAKAVGLGLTVGAVEIFRTVTKEKK